METQGVPTAVIITDGFIEAARLQREALGMSALKPCIIEHPLSTLTEDEISERAQEAAAQARGVLLST